MNFWEKPGEILEGIPRKTSFEIPNVNPGNISRSITKEIFEEIPEEISFRNYWGN